MPNLNEFFHKPEVLHKESLEKIDGLKPCSKCEQDAEYALWDPQSMILSWTCPSNHANQIKVE